MSFTKKHMKEELNVWPKFFSFITEKKCSTSSKFIHKPEVNYGTYILHLVINI